MPPGDLLWLGGAPFAIFTPDDPAGPLAHYVRRHGPGLHSLAWTVDDLWQTENGLRTGGVRITGTDIDGRHFFMHPGDSAGVLIEWTDTAFACDPRDGADPPQPQPWGEPGLAPIEVRALAWTTAVVADLEVALDTLSRLMDLSVLTGNPAGHPEQEQTVDLAVGDTVLRLVSPRGTGSRYADVLGGRPGRLHALCLGVPDLDAALAGMPAHGIRLSGRDEHRAWTDPASTAGVPLEWVEL